MQNSRFSETNFNDTQWLSTDRLRVISPLCLPGLGAGIHAAVILILMEIHCRCTADTYAQVLLCSDA